MTSHFDEDCHNPAVLVFLIANTSFVILLFMQKESPLTYSNNK